MDPLNKKNRHIEGCVALCTGWELIWYQVREIRRREEEDYDRRIRDNVPLTTLQCIRAQGRLY